MPLMVTSARTRPRMGWDASSPSSLSAASSRIFQLILFFVTFIILERTLPGLNESAPAPDCTTLRTPFCPLAIGVNATLARTRGRDVARALSPGDAGAMYARECARAVAIVPRILLGVLVGSG